MQNASRPLVEKDLPAISAIHLAAFPKSALSRLGKGAVRRYYYWLLTGPHPDSFTIGAWQGEQLAGFCFGGKFRGALSGFLRKNRAYLAWRVLTHPWLIRRAAAGYAANFWHFGHRHASSLSRPGGRAAADGTLRTRNAAKGLFPPEPERGGG
jgi:hypothetical protein